MSLQRSDLARLRLVSQGLMEPWASPALAVAAFGCTQGQDLPGSTLSLALRTRGRRLAEVHEAYDAGLIVRSWPMRGTLFVVLAADLGWMLTLTAEKVIRSTARRREQLGLTDSQLERAARIARDALNHTALGRAELLAAFTEGGHGIDGGRGYHTLFHLAVQGLIVQGPMGRKENLWVRSDQWIRTPRAFSGADAIAHWLRRYLDTHGPVPISEFLWWTKLLKRDLGEVLPQLRTEYRQVELDGVEYWFRPELPDRASDLGSSVARPLLLPGFDEYILGYGDRSHALTREQEALVVPGGNGIFRPTVIHRGRAVATWQRATRKGQPAVARPFTGTLNAVVSRALPALTAALPRSLLTAPPECPTVRTTAMSARVPCESGSSPTDHPKGRHHGSPPGGHRTRLHR